MKKTELKRKSPLKAKVGRKPKPKQSTLKNKADKLAAEFCKREGRCEARGWGNIKCSDRLEWAHVKSRRHAHIRHDPNNACSLCNLHHRLFTEHPDYWVDFIEEKYPGRWEYLNRIIAETHGKKPDYEKWIEFYKEVEINAQT